MGCVIGIISLLVWVILGYLIVFSSSDREGRGEL